MLSSIFPFPVIILTIILSVKVVDWLPSYHWVSRG